MTAVGAESCTDNGSHLQRRLPGRLHRRVDQMLVIDPEERIDRGACEPACPVEAIFPEDASAERRLPFVRTDAARLEGPAAVEAALAEARG